MLSRVAERLFWMSRYLERADNTARLGHAYSHMVLDIPIGAELGWTVLLDTLDARESFATRYQLHNERNVLKYLLADNNVNSVRHSVQAARENMRTTRDVLPEEAWELVNELFLFIEANAAKSVTRQRRYEFLDQVSARNQQINGLLDATVLRDHGLRFLRLGRLIERADMTSRILDTVTDAIIQSKDRPDQAKPLLWSHMLQSLSATSAYRRKVGPTRSAPQVVEFAFKEEQFPRSLIYCLNKIEEIIGGLKAPHGMLQELRRLVRLVQSFDPEEASVSELHDFIDAFQAALGSLSEGIHEVWFAR